MSQDKLKTEEKIEVETESKGGRGYKLKGYAAGISSPSPTPTTAPSTTQHATNKLSTSIASTNYPTTAPQMLPTGFGIPDAYQARLKQLASLYAELRQTEAALHMTATYLPKLKIANKHVTDAMAEHRAKLKEQIASLSTPIEATCAPSSKKSNQKS